jgi:hypothetical protein
MKFQHKLKLALLGIGLTVAMASWTDEWTSMLKGLKGDVPAPSFEAATCNAWVMADFEVTTQITPVDPRARLNDFEKINTLPSSERQEVEMCLNTNNSLNELRITQKAPTMKYPKHMSGGFEIDNEATTIIAKQGSTVLFDANGRKTAEYKSDLSGLNEFKELSEMILDMTSIPTKAVEEARTKGLIINEDSESVRFKSTDTQNGEYTISMYNSKRGVLEYSDLFDSKNVRLGHTEYFYSCNRPGEKNPEKIIITTKEKSPYSSVVFNHTTTIKFYSLQSSTR